MEFLHKVHAEDFHGFSRKALNHRVFLDTTLILQLKIQISNHQRMRNHFLHYFLSIERAIYECQMIGEVASAKTVAPSVLEKCQQKKAGNQYPGPSVHFCQFN
jgi:hypothetical protein